MVTVRATLFLSGSLLAWSVPAMAQEAAPGAVPSAVQPTPEARTDNPRPGSEATQDSAEIIVTATRRAEALKDVPLSVDVVSGADIKKLNLFDFKDVQALSPGLQLTNNDGRSNVATLRGVTFDPDSGSSPAVTVYINEVPVDPQTAFTGIYDVGQIEVLRGPQGIFRGQTSPAGSITLTTRRPNLNEPEGYVQATGTLRGSGNFQGGASIPLVPGTLAIRGAVLVDANRANQVRNVNGERSRGDTESARLSLRWSPSSKFNSVLTYQYLTNDVSPYIAVFGPGKQPSLLDPSRSGPALSIGDRRSVTEARPRFQNRTNLVTLAADYHFDGATLSFNGGYQDTLLKQSRDQDVANAVPNKSLNQTTSIPYRTWNADLRLTSSGDGPFSWSVGGNYFNTKNSVDVTQENDVFSGFAFTPLPAALATFPIDVAVQVPVKSIAYSGTASVGYEFTPTLKIEAGARYNWADIRRQSFLSVFLPTFGIYQLKNFPTISPQGADQHFRALTGGASLTWKVTPDVTTYVSYGRSFRPGVSAVAVTTPLDSSILITPKETSDSGEVGIKTSLFERRVNVNVSAFYQKFKNYIGYEPALTTNSSRVAGAVDPSTAPLPTFGNASSRGIEGQISARISDAFDLSVNASYADAHYDNAQIYCNDYNGDGAPDSNGTPRVPAGRQVAVCTRNDRLAQIPRFNLTANGEVHFAAGQLQPFLRGLVSYRPGFDSELDNYSYRAFTNISLFGGLRGPDNKWELSVFAKNLLDQARATRVGQGVATYPTTGLDPVTFQPTGAAGAPFDSGYRTAVISPPREIGVSLNFNW
ncbi:TonB-dependent receptor [Sphingomonas sp. RP10(2022)]|uniref:TonB-dependent receptor n=1 Tax=Sphingomonas liriopis TaxID=2949094 RepID=A0A9X2HQX9_9SPHN|nr:TonB-dependent receptor [Sphingomonas liriopis]MCP3735886.1 TonB-dependent receptor [Sphingomonas liriopis]